MALIRNAPSVNSPLIHTIFQGITTIRSIFQTPPERSRKREQVKPFQASLRMVAAENILKVYANLPDGLKMRSNSRISEK